MHRRHGVAAAALAAWAVCVHANYVTVSQLYTDPPMRRRAVLESPGPTYASNTGDKGGVSYAFTCTADTSVAVTAAALVLGTMQDTLYIHVDEGARRYWSLGDGDVRNEWAATTVSPSIAVAAGDHVIHITEREDGARFDAFTLTEGSPPCTWAASGTDTVAAVDYTAVTAPWTVVELVEVAGRMDNPNSCAPGDIVCGGLAELQVTCAIASTATLQLEALVWNEALHIYYSVNSGPWTSWDLGSTTYWDASTPTAPLALAAGANQIRLSGERTGLKFTGITLNSDSCVLEVVGYKNGSSVFTPSPVAVWPTPRPQATGLPVVLPTGFPASTATGTPSTIDPSGVVSVVIPRAGTTTGGPPAQPVGAEDTGAAPDDGAATPSAASVSLARIADTVSVVSILSGSPLFASQAQVAMLDCTLDDTLPFFLHPTQMRLGTARHDLFLSCILGNAVVCAACWAACAAVVAAIRSCGRFTLEGAMGLVRFPSLPGMVFLWLFQGLTLSAVALLAGPWWWLGVGAWLLATFACWLTVYATRRVRQQAVYAYDPRVTGEGRPPARHILLGPGEWKSTQLMAVERYGLFFEQCTPRLPLFLAAEIALAWAIAVLAGVQHASPSWCTARFVLIAILFAAFAVAVAALQPYARPINTVLTAAACTLLSVGYLIIGAASSRGVGDVFMAMGLVLLLLRALAECAVRVYAWASRRAAKCVAEGTGLLGSPQHRAGLTVADMDVFSGLKSDDEMQSVRSEGEGLGAAGLGITVQTEDSVHSSRVTGTRVRAGDYISPTIESKTFDPSLESRTEPSSKPLSHQQSADSRTDAHATLRSCPSSSDLKTQLRRANSLHQGPSHAAQPRLSRVNSNLGPMAQRRSVGSVGAHTPLSRRSSRYAPIALREHLGQTDLLSRATIEQPQPQPQPPRRVGSGVAPPSSLRRDSLPEGAASPGRRAASFASPSWRRPTNLGPEHMRRQSLGTNVLE